MPRVRVRKLWIKVHFQAPEQDSEERVIRQLIRSIRRGDYRLPRGYRAVIEWKNSATAPWRHGEWRAELEASANGPSGSQGFENAVISYLEKQL